MNNFKQGGPGGLRGRQEYFGGRPASDADYGKKKTFDKKPSFGGKPSFDKKPSFGGKGGFKGGDRGGSRGGDRGGFGGNRGGFGGGRDGERREMTMHKATCSTCGKPCEVPFRPDGSKPVLCSECFGKNRSDDRNGVERRNDRFSNDRPKRDFDAPRKEHTHNHDFNALQTQVTALETKVDEILSLLKGAPVAKVAKAPKAEKTEEVAEVKKVVAKKAVAKKAAPAAKKAPVKKAAPKKVAKKVTKKK
jgi:CxxC-x17-CxxC domain-containing protein